MENKRFEITETAGSVKGFYVVVDKETGVNYLVAKFGAGAGICPLIKMENPLLQSNCLWKRDMPCSLNIGCCVQYVRVKPVQKSEQIQF